MSFGIGDAISVGDLILKAWKTCSEAPDQMDAAAEDVKNMMENLHYLGETVGKPDSFVQTRGRKLASMLEQNMKDLMTDLKRIENLIKKWTRICSLGWFEATIKKGNFIIKDLREVEDLNLKLEKHDKRIGRLLRTLHIGVSEGIYAALEKQRKQDAAESKERAKESKKWKNYLDENGTEKLSQAVRSPDEKVWEKLKNDLTKNGISEIDMEATMRMIQNNLHKLKVEPTPASSVPAPAAAAIQKPPPPRKQEHIRILCVDGSNNIVRSVIAQAYLELVRVWTANTSKQWLFKEVESASCGVVSMFTKKYQAEAQIKTALQPRAKHSNNKALRAHSEQDHFRSEERTEIFRRLLNSTSRGINAVHFNDFDYIIYFDQPTHDLLENLKPYAKNCAAGKPQRAKLVLFKGAELFEDLDKTIHEVKMATRRWLEHEFKWVRPLASIKNGPWRTRQMTIPDECFSRLTAKKGAGREEIEAKSGCKLWISSKRQDPQTLLSIVGPQEVLSKAEALVRKLFPEQQAPPKTPKPKNTPEVTPRIVVITPKGSKEGDTVVSK
ncbi:MAG: hypothetical protein Q9187_004413 [Circinaria calcarea]